MRLSEKKEEETFQELPLCQIRGMYQHLPCGEKFLADLLASRNLGSRKSASTCDVSLLPNCHRSERQDAPAVGRRELEDLQSLQECELDKSLEQH